MNSTNIAIPTSGPGGLDAERSAHFGRADSFTIVRVTDGAIAGTSTVVNPPHEHGGCSSIVSLLAEAGVDTAIVVGMGRGPLAAMNAHGMTPLFDNTNATPRAAVEAYLAGDRVMFGGEHGCSGGH